MKNIIKTIYPSSWWKGKWRDAFPSGNGKTGISVYGSADIETILLNHSMLWQRKNNAKLVDVSDKLDEVRNLLINGEAEKADKILSQELISKGYKPKCALPLPLGDIEIEAPIINGFKNYSRELNMENGEITVSYTDGDEKYIKKTFVSRCKDVIVYKIKKANLKNALEFHIRLVEHDSDGRLKGNGEIVKIPDDFTTKYENDTIYYSGKNDDGTDFGAVSVIICDGDFSVDNKGLFVSCRDDEVLVLTKVFIDGVAAKKWNELKSELDNIKMSYDDLLSEHQIVHFEMFNRVSFAINDIDTVETDQCNKFNEELLVDAYRNDVSDELLYKLWAYGRYLIISATATDSLPCCLTGIWCGEYNGVWAFNMANENLQMIYWQVLSGNLPHLLLPVFSYYEEKMQDFRENAQKLYGCKGIYIPAVSTPESGLISVLAPHIIHWTGAAGWIAQMYFDYYLYTNDIEFLKERAIPFMKEVAQFYEDFFVIGEDGYFISYPSNSPENNPKEYWKGEGMGANMETTINATMDFAICKELLNNLLAASNITGLCEEKVSDWERMLTKIPPYQINEDGALKEWMHPYFTDNYNHRHQAHLYPLFPGREIFKERDPELYEACKIAILKRNEVGLRQQTGWSLAHMANIYSRLSMGDEAINCIDLIARSCVMNNLMTLHNDWRKMGIGVNMGWAPFQIDCNMGITAAIFEMLCFSSNDIIKVMPALPKRFKKGEIKNMLLVGGDTISIKWDVYNIEASIKGVKDRSVMIVFPEGFEAKYSQNQMKKNCLNVEIKTGEIINVKAEKIVH